MRPPAWSALVLGVALLANGAHAACRPGLHPATTAQLFFGLNVGVERSVAEADWRRFLDTEVTPRFPDGLSVWDVDGQWKDPAGFLSREPAKTLLIILPGAAGDDAKLATIIDLYKTRFHQESVLLMEQDACVAF